MARRKSVVQVKMSGEIRNDLRRSPRLGRQYGTLSPENFENPNLKPASAPRRSPRIGGLRDTDSAMDPKAPTLESVRKQARVLRDKTLISPPSSGRVSVNVVDVEVRQKQEARKSFVSELRRSPRFRKSRVEQLVGSKSVAFEKKLDAEVKATGGPENMIEERLGLRRSPRFSNQQKNYEDADQKLDAEVKTTGGPENMIEERLGLRRSPRFSNQQKNYEDADQKLNSLSDEICGNEGGSTDQSVKGNTRKSNSPVGSEAQMGEEASWKNEGKGAEAGKRKRKRGKEGTEVVRGWTKEQETALERAYMAMKPTPHFWKKVAKMVGKSAHECFDRVNYDPHTPVPPRIRSRIKKKTSSPMSGFSLSASKLLGSPKPTRKRKTQLGQKKVRELLQKQCNIENDYEGDLFSVLEGNMASSFLFKISQQAPGASTPPAVSLRNGSNSFSARKKSVSRFGKAALLVSPLVLKHVKNKALHEKYIDQLHCREAKRKAELTRAKKTTFGKENLAPPSTTKAAKDALKSDARDVILQFQKALNNSPSETEDDMGLSSNENEDEL